MSNSKKSIKSGNVSTTEEKINFLMMNFHKENRAPEQIKEVEPKGQEIIDLEEDLSTPKKLKPILKPTPNIPNQTIPHLSPLPLAKPSNQDQTPQSQEKKPLVFTKPSSVLNLPIDDRKSTSSSTSSKKYSKESHALKIAFLNRATSNCPSQSSKLSFRKRKNPLKTNAFLPSDLQSVGGKSANSGVSSTFSSKAGQSRIGESKKSSLLNYGIKQEAGEFSSLRKKVCRKIYEIFSKEYITDKKEAKRVTLELEKKINFFFNSSMSKKRYIGVIKIIFKKLRVSALCLNILEQQDPPN